MATNIRLVQEDCTCALVPTDAWRDGLYAVDYCDLHRAAREMYEALRALLLAWPGPELPPQDVFALLAKIDGGNARDGAQS